MRSNRTIQTIVQALTLVLVAAIFFKLDQVAGQQGGPGGAAGGISAPTEADIKHRYRAWFNEDDEVSTKATLLSVRVEAVSVEGATAQVMLGVEIKWEGHNITYNKGPLRGAPGQRGDQVRYTQVFPFRYWGERRGWDIEERRTPAIIQ